MNRKWCWGRDGGGGWKEGGSVGGEKNTKSAKAHFSLKKKLIDRTEIVSRKKSEKKK